MFVTGRERESEREWACVRTPSHWPASRMDKPSVWRAVVSSTDPRRMRDPGSHSSRPGSAMGYRLYDMWVVCLVWILAGRQVDTLNGCSSHSWREQWSGWWWKTQCLALQCLCWVTYSIQTLLYSLVFPSCPPSKQCDSPGEGRWGGTYVCLCDGDGKISPRFIKSMCIYTKWWNLSVVLYLRVLQYD